MKKYFFIILALVLFFSIACKNESTHPPPTYKVTYDYNYEGAESKQLTDQTSVVKPKAPTREGYVISYWDFDGSIFNDWNSPLKGDITLKAIWGKPISSTDDLPKDSEGYRTLDDHYVLQNDIIAQGTIRIKEDAIATLNLNGFKIDKPNEYRAFSNYGNLTIIDSSKEQTGIICNSVQEKTINTDTHPIFYNTNVLTINGGTFGDCDTDKTNENLANLGPAVYNNGGSVVINGGNFSGHDGLWKVKPDNNPPTGYSHAIINISGTMTINHCNLYGKMIGGIKSTKAGANVTINSGNFTINGPDSEYLLRVTESGKITVKGGDFTKTGGKKDIIGPLSGNWEEQTDLSKDGFFITGGTFNKDGKIKNYSASISE